MKTKSTTISLVVLLLTATFASVYLMHESRAAGSPWDDDDSDGTPNYLDKLEFKVCSLERGNVSLFGIDDFEVTAYYISSSGNGSYKAALSSLGITDVYAYDVTVASVVELKMPFTNQEFIDFLTGYHLLNPEGYMPSVLEALNIINCSDGRIRGLVTFQYTELNASASRMRTCEYFFNGSNPTAFVAPGNIDNSLDISPSFTIGDQLIPQQSKTTKAGGTILTIIGWIENLIDFLKGKAAWRVIAEKLGNMLVGKAAQWFIGKIVGLIGGPGALVVVDIIKMLLDGKGICVLLDALKKLLAKLGVSLPWWFPDPPVSEGNVDLHLYSSAGSHLLGVDYSANTTDFSFSHGIYSGDIHYYEIMFVSREMLESDYLKVLAINKGNTTDTYTITIEDPVKDQIIIGPGQLDIDETVHTQLYLVDSENITCNQIWMEANFSSLAPPTLEPVNVSISLKDENGTSISDASIVTIVTNGVQMFEYVASNLGGGGYQCLIDTSDMCGSYYVAVYPEVDGYFPDNKYCTLLTRWLDWLGQRGARADYLDVYWYPTQAGAFAALQAGDIDLIQGSITEGQRTAVEADPNLSIAAYVENGVVSYDAWWKTVAGVVNTFDCGLENTYTFLNSYYTFDQHLPLRMGCTAQPESLNILYSQGDHEYAFLDRIYTNLLSVNPYDIVIDQPWIAQDWEVSTWLDPQDASEKTVATYWIQQDVGIAAPSTGAFAGFFNAYDVEFTIWYIYSFPDNYQWNNVAGVHHTEIINNHAIKVYFDDFNASLPRELGKRMPLLVSDELLDLLCRQEGDSWTQAGTNEHMLTYDAVQVCNASLNGAPLLEGWDYIIRGDDVYSHSVFVPLRDLTGTVTITYWYADIPANGFYLAGLPWNQTMFSLGTYYPTAIELEGLAWAWLDKNPFFFLETPPLGETDWRVWWDTPGGIPGPEIPGRDSGHYEINIYDVIKATACYKHHGNGPYDPQYFPGADLDQSDLGHIGIYDVVTITGKYGMKWGHPDT